MYSADDCWRSCAFFLRVRDPLQSLVSVPAFLFPDKVKVIENKVVSLTLEKKLIDFRGERKKTDRNWDWNHGLRSGEQPV